MRWLITGLVLIAVLTGCKTTTIQQVEARWGPPGKVEDRGETVLYFYYFNKSYGGASVVTRKGVGVGSARATYGIVVVEITTDRTGKILSKRKYWEQPDR